MDRLDLMVEKTTTILPTLKLTARTRLATLAEKSPDPATVGRGYDELVFTRTERDVMLYYIHTWEGIAIEKRLAVLALLKQYEKGQLRFSFLRWICSLVRFQSLTKYWNSSGSP